MKLLHVVAAVIVDNSDRVLIAQRPLDKHMGGLWEFPGGKVEQGETVTDALCRELDEELGIQPVQWQPLIRIPHHYPDKSVLLDVWTVTGFTGYPHGREGQPIQWVPKGALLQYDFPAANDPIIAAVQLPRQYLITGPFNGCEELVSHVSVALAQGIAMVQFRAPWLSDEEYVQAVTQLLPLFEEPKHQLIVKGALSWLDHKGVGGLHLTSAQLQALHDQGWRYRGGKCLMASCHNQQQLDMAATVGARCATLSPVQATSSHVDAVPLGWDMAASLIDNAALPVYCLGGLSNDSLPQAVRIGAQGVAAISCWWPQS